MKFDDHKPIYQQIISYIKLKLITGFWKPNEKLPSIREFSAQLNVNPNTVQKAFAELEREEFIYAKRGTGNFVTDDPEKILLLSKNLAETKIKEFLCTMQDMGFSIEEIIELITIIGKEENYGNNN